MGVPADAKVLFFCVWGVHSLGFGTLFFLFLGRGLWVKTPPLPLPGCSASPCGAWCWSGRWPKTWARWSSRSNCRWGGPGGSPKLGWGGHGWEIGEGGTGGSLERLGGSWGVPKTLGEGSWVGNSRGGTGGSSGGTGGAGKGPQGPWGGLGSPHGGSLWSGGGAGWGQGVFLGGVAALGGFWVPLSFWGSRPPHPQGSKRILRSNEIPLPPGGPPETELQLTFSLQVRGPPKNPPEPPRSPSPQCPELPHT